MSNYYTCIRQIRNYASQILIITMILLFPVCSFPVQKRSSMPLRAQPKKVEPSVLFPAIEKWNVPIEVELEYNLYAVTGESLFIPAPDNTLYKINLKDGKFITFDDDRFSDIQNIFAYNNLIYLVSKNDIYSLNARNYEIKKLLSLEAPIIHSKINNNIILLLLKNQIISYDLSSNNFKSFSSDSSHEFIDLLSYQSNIIGISSDGYIIAYSDNAIKKWELRLEGSLKTAGVIGNSVLYQPSHNYFYAIDLSRGHVKWKIMLGNEVNFQPLFSQNRIYIAPTNNLLYCLSTKGNKIWVKPLKYRIITPFLDTNNEIIASVHPGELNSFSRKEGVELGKYSPQSKLLLNMYLYEKSLILIHPEKIVCVQKQETPATKK